MGTLSVAVTSHADETWSLRAVKRMGCLLDDTGRITDVIRDDAAMRKRWQRAMELASTMADDEKVPAGTRYVGVGVGKRWSRPFMKAAPARGSPSGRPTPSACR